jgi:hypothetical protein
MKTKREIIIALACIVIKRRNKIEIEIFKSNQTAKKMLVRTAVCLKDLKTMSISKNMLKADIIAKTHQK